MRHLTVKITLQEKSSADIRPYCQRKAGVAYVPASTPHGVLRQIGGCCAQEYPAERPFPSVAYSAAAESGSRSSWPGLSSNRCARASLGLRPTIRSRMRRPKRGLHGYGDQAAGLVSPSRIIDFVEEGSSENTTAVASWTQPFRLTRWPK